MTKRRQCIVFILSIIVSTIAFFTGHVYYLVVTLISILTFTILICIFLLVYEANKTYKTIIGNMKYIRWLEEKRYKAYFSFTGEQLESKIRDYDNEIEKAYQKTLRVIKIFEKTKLKGILFKKKCILVEQIRKEIQKESGV